DVSMGVGQFGEQPEKTAIARQPDGELLNDGNVIGRELLADLRPDHRKPEEIVEGEPVLGFLLAQSNEFELSFFERLPPRRGQSNRVLQHTVRRGKVALQLPGGPKV